MDFIKLMAQALYQHGLQRTEAALGDRSAYVGMSDIGKAAACLRSAVAGKVAEAPSARSLERQLRLNRGHWFESGIAEAFHFSGQPYLYQVRIETAHNGVPIRAHPDFIFIDPQGEARVVELKSCEHLPDTAYASHEMQLFGQLGLLASLWHKPCFSLCGDEKPVSFPDLVKQSFGFTLPEQAVLSGRILCVSMSGAKVFGPYAPNDLMLSACLKLAGQIWNGLKKVKAGASLDELPTATGFNPLCDWCEWNTACPRFTNVPAPELEEDLLEWQKLKAEKEALEARIQAMEGQIRSTCKTRKGKWLAAETRRIRLTSCEGKRSFDKDLLQAALARHLDADTACSVMAAAYKNGKPYDRLMVSNIN
jgi:hypothetical protein